MVRVDQLLSFQLYSRDCLICLPLYIKYISEMSEIRCLMTRLLGEKEKTVSCRNLSILHLSERSMQLHNTTECRIFFTILDNSHQKCETVMMGLLKTDGFPLKFLCTCTPRRLRALRVFPVIVGLQDVTVLGHHED